MPNFDDPVYVRVNGKVRSALPGGFLGIFVAGVDPDEEWAFLADGLHCLPDKLWISTDDKVRVYLEGDHGNLWLGGGGEGGDVVLFPGEVNGAMPGDVKKSTILLAGDPGVIILRNKQGDETVVVDGPAGDIILKNADCAEDFPVDDNQAVEPGSVLVVGDAGRLRLSDQPYDRRVAGVVSGAGGLKPGVVLGRQATDDTAVPIGLAGRVGCKVDAAERPVATGDLLTTSAVPGHAMAVDDPGRALGAVLGKALAPLTSGQGILPVLVSLQ
jgi:hypothetical protein